MSIQVKKPLRHFVDISLAFSPHPLTGDFSVLRDDRAITASLKNCIMIGVTEKPFNSEFGSNILKSLFDMADHPIMSLLEDEIRRTIQFNEPRVELIEVYVEPKPELNEVRVEIEYLIKGLDETFTYTHILYPTR